ncbi:HAD-IIIA family hydrolase [Flavobacteriales bacterium]|nr:HAD-IIIA family hydrolase [Flavobacteriales bacterium]
MKLPKLIITDIDGVWTDGGMYYDQTGNEWKKFNTSDSWGVAMCKAYNIRVVIMSGEETEIVRRRAKKLKIDDCFLGVKNKLKDATEFIDSVGLSLSDVAFIGDDLNDYKLFQSVGYGACPNNAPYYIQETVDFVCEKNGGDGAFREFVEHILLRKCSIEEIIDRVV